MSDILDRLKTALADRYAIERELGVGGMATVYLTDDLKHERQVAIKVLRPELATALGPSASFAKSRSPPDSPTHTSCLFTTRVRRTGSSTT